MYDTSQCHTTGHCRSLETGRLVNMGANSEQILTNYILRAQEKCTAINNNFSLVDVFSFCPTPSSFSVLLLAIKTSQFFKISIC